VICIVAAIVAVVSYIGSGALYRGIGKGDFHLDSDEARPGPKPQTAASRAEAEAEIRQMVEAKSHRRVARGQAPLDVEAEIAALTKPAETVHDAALRDEVRQLVIARNERRARQGKEPLDVETEIDRQLRDLGA
jgi:hypothetical protein